MSKIKTIAELALSGVALIWGVIVGVEIAAGVWFRRAIREFETRATR